MNEWSTERRTLNEEEWEDCSEERERGGLRKMMEWLNELQRNVVNSMQERILLIQRHKEEEEEDMEDSIMDSLMDSIHLEMEEVIHSNSILDKQLFDRSLTHSIPPSSCFTDGKPIVFTRCFAPSLNLSLSPIEITY